MSSCLLASATVGPCLTTLVSMYGGEDEKGTIIGIFRSLGALSRAVGPVIASTGENQYSVLSVMFCVFIVECMINAILVSR